MSDQLIEGTQKHNPGSGALVEPSAEHTVPIFPALVRESRPEGNPLETGWLARYRLIKQLGKGGMGLVFLAEDTRLRRQVALKVMHPRWRGEVEARERFVREARAAAAIKHDNVVTIYEVDEEANTPYIAMEFLRGTSLERYLDKKGPPPLSHILRLGREMAAGLGAAHDNGLVHRDIKPANVWLESPTGRVKLLDFGLARIDHDETRLTGFGTVMGTPGFMAPEQARGERVDHRADLFSLGAVLYTLCTGRVPFPGDTVMAVLTSLAVDRPKPIRSLNENIPTSLCDLIEKLLAKQPDDRPASAREVIQALKAVERAPVEAPMEVEAEPLPDESSQPSIVSIETERMPSVPRKRKRGRRRDTPNWNRLIARLIGGLSLVVASIILIHATTRRSSSTTPTEPEKPAAKSTPKLGAPKSEESKKEVVENPPLLIQQPEADPPEAAPPKKEFEKKGPFPRPPKKDGYPPPFRK